MSKAKINWKNNYSNFDVDELMALNIGHIHHGNGSREWIQFTPRAMLFPLVVLLLPYWSRRSDGEGFCYRKILIEIAWERVAIVWEWFFSEVMKRDEQSDGWER